MILRNNGKEFEEIVSNIYRQFSSSGTVLATDDKILGKSGRKRQIDISLKTDIAGNQVLIIIECKDYKRKVDIQRVDELIGKMDDVNAHGGVLISNSGFTSTAVERAKQSGRVRLCTVLDSNNGKLRSKLNIPTKVTFENFKEPYKVEVKIQNIGQNGSEKVELRFCEEIIREKGFEALKEVNDWIKTEAENFPTGDYSRDKIIFESDIVVISLKVNFSKVLRSFVNENIFTECIGIYDYTNKSLIKGNIGNTTFEENNIIEHWKEIDPEDYTELTEYKRVNSYDDENMKLTIEKLLEQFPSYA